MALTRALALVALFAGRAAAQQCVETPRQVALAEQTPLGFSAADVLANVGGAVTLDLKWLPRSMYATHGRATTTTELWIAFAPQKASVTFVDSKGGGCIGGHGPCVSCTPRLEISVEARFYSGDGALGEDQRVTLVTSSVKWAKFALDVGSAAIAGTLLREVAPDPGYEVIGLHIEASFGTGFPGSRRTVPGVWNGFVAARVRQTGRPKMRGVYTAHGYFPARTAP